MNKRLELAKRVLAEILKHPDFYPPKALEHNPAIGEICPQCGQNDSHMPWCIIGLALALVNDWEIKETPERVGPVRGEQHVWPDTDWLPVMDNIREAGKV